MINTLEVLKKAKKKIAKKKNWCQEVMARDKDGNPTKYHVGESVKFCAMGAIHRVCYEHKMEWLDTSLDAIDLLAEQTGTNDMIEYNDTHTHKEVLAVFDKAIKELATVEAKL